MKDVRCFEGAKEFNIRPLTFLVYFLEKDQTKWRKWLSFYNSSTFSTASFISFMEIKPSGASGCSSAERYRRADMLVRPYRLHKFGGASGWVYAIAVLFQQPHSFISFMETKIRWREAVRLVQDGTVGRICKSAPTVFLNSMAQAVGFMQ